MENIHDLHKIGWGVIPVTVYRGCLVTKIIGGYEIFGQKVSNPEEVDEVIDKAGTILNESIDRGGVTVKDGFSCVNGDVDDGKAYLSQDLGVGIGGNVPQGD